MTVSIFDKFSNHVHILTKPGKDIKESMSYIQFSKLGTVLDRVVLQGAHLDAAKKSAIYQKAFKGVDIDKVPHFHFAPAFSKLDDAKCDLLHVTAGIIGESTEIGEAIIDHLNGKALDKKNLAEEIGDCLFFLQRLSHHAGVSLEECMEANIKKLRTRYPEGYSDKAAQERLDKVDKS